MIKELLKKYNLKTVKGKLIIDDNDVEDYGYAKYPKIPLNDQKIIAMSFSTMETKSGKEVKIWGSKTVDK